MLDREGVEDEDANTDMADAASDVCGALHAKLFEWHDDV